LQELEDIDSKGDIILYYADESHVCTNGYVPYGWQYKDEDVYIPAAKAARLNIFGMITRRNDYRGFTTQKSINADKVVEYLDAMSFTVKKKTVIVLDKASVHRNRKIKELRKIWERRGLFLFYLPPYSPELNIAEILWRILKGKWLRPIDYATADNLFYAAHSALAAVGKLLKVNYSL
jgi:transposase